MRAIALLSAAFSLVLSAQPVLRIDRQHFDLGRIPEKVIAKFTFTLSNSGNALLQIPKIETSCNCSTTSPVKPTLKPGESMNVELRFDPTSMKGRVEKSVCIHSNDPKQQEALLTFSAEVVPDILCSQYSVFFSNLLRSQKVTQTVNIKASSGAPLKILEAQASDAPFLNLQPKSDGSASRLDITLDGDQLPKGKQQGEGALRLKTNHSTSPELQIPFYWALVPSINAKPPQLEFIPAKAPKPAKTQETISHTPAPKALESKSITLRQILNRPFRLLGIKNQPAFLQVDGIPAGALPEHTLTFHLDRSKVQKSSTCLITVETDDIDQKAVEFRIYIVNGA